MCANDEVWFAVLVDDFRTCLKPQPLQIFGQQSIRNETGASSLDYCTHSLITCYKTNSLARLRRSIQGGSNNIPRDKMQFLNNWEKIIRFVREISCYNSEIFKEIILVFSKVMSDYVNILCHIFNCVRDNQQQLVDFIVNKTLTNYKIPKSGQYFISS